MKGKLKQNGVIFSSTARCLIVVWGIIVISFGIFGIWVEFDLRAIGFYIAGVFAAPVGLWLAWRRTHALQEQARADAEKANALIEQAKANTLQAKIDSKRQFNEAFVREVELLGNDNAVVRQGAIRALAGLARENSEQHQIIFNIITSYIRERSRIMRQENLKQPRVSIKEEMISRSNAAVDIEAAMQELAARNIKYDREIQDILNLFNLSGAELRDIIIKENAELQRIGFINADLSYAWLSRANLSKSVFKGANLFSVVLVEAKLHGADFREAENLTQEQVDHAKGNQQTLLPKGIRRPSHWD